MGYCLELGMDNIPLLLEINVSMKTIDRFHPIKAKWFLLQSGCLLSFNFVTNLCFIDLPKTGVFEISTQSIYNIIVFSISNYL